MLKPIKVEENQLIYKEGDPIDEIFFLVSGQAGFVLSNNPKAVFVIIDQGSYFGEIDFIYQDKQGVNDGKRKFTAKALHDCDLLILKKEDLLKADEEFQDVMSELFRNGHLRLKRTLKIKKAS
jgi:CRP-like cAMP-binding protein